MDFGTKKTRTLTPDLKLDKAFEMARNYEQIRIQMKGEQATILDEVLTKVVNFWITLRPKPKISRKKCSRWNRLHEWGRCPVKGEKCKKIQPPQSPRNMLPDENKQRPGNKTQHGGIYFRVTYRGKYKALPMVRLFEDFQLTLEV